MKTKLSILLIASCALIDFAALAQTSGTVTAPPSLLPQPGVAGAPPVNTNSASFTNITLEAYTGYSYVSGQVSASQSKLGLWYNLYKGFGPSVEMANEASGNVIADMDAFMEYHKQISSLEPLFGLGMGYNWDDHSPLFKAKFGVNYNLTQVGSYFMFVGVEGVVADEFNNKANSRPSVGGFLKGGFAF